MAELIIKNVNIVLLDSIRENAAIICSDGKISKICDSNEIEAADAIDGGGKFLLPGFIDMHIHGMGKYLIDNGKEELDAICETLPKYGVTGFLPTVCPLPKGEDAELLGKLSQVESQGAEILGFHLEGPFLSLTGALPKEALGDADIERVENLIKAGNPYKVIFSTSPDFEKITDLIPLMASNDTPVFMTHTKANVKQTLEAIKAGASHATHFYDVFYIPEESDPGVRPCGAVEAILASPEVSVDFILDGEHVDPIAVKMALQCKGPDRVCLVTDANIGAGTGAGKFKFGKEEVEFEYLGAPARGSKNSRSPGCLYGSGLTMNMAVKNAMDMLGIDLPMAARMASANPAKTLRLNNSKGQIKVGYDADFILADENIDIKQTWVKAKCRYKNEN